MGKTMAVLAVCCLVMACCAQAEEVTIEAEGRYWFPDLDAKAKIVSNNIGETVDFSTDLGIPDEDYPEARIIWHTGPDSRIRLFYSAASYDADQVISRTLYFDGKTYTLGSQVKSELDLQYFGLGWTWEFVKLFDDALKLGTIIDLKGIAGEASLNAPALSINESEEFVAGLPTFGLAADITPIKENKYLGTVKLFAEMAGMSAGSYGYFFDAEMGLKVAPMKYFTVSGGYRVFKIKAEYDSNEAQFELSGPFVGASLRF